MSETDDFLIELLNAIDAKTDWYNTNELPQLLTEYRNLQLHVSNLIQSLLKKGLITEDPYKNEKKISGITVPDNAQYADTERQIILGARLSDYESILDFICNYMRFSVDAIDVDKIKQLMALNNCFQWTNISITSTKPNTRGIAEIVSIMKNGSDNISISVVNDSISHAAKCLTNITTILKELTDFQKEIYKSLVRKNIFTLPDFVSNVTSAETLLSFIKKQYSSTMHKTPYYSELIDEIVQEEYGENKIERRTALLDKMKVQKTEIKKKQKEVIPKDFLMDAIRTLAGISPQLEQICKKFEENKTVLESEHHTFWDQLKIIFRKAFNMPEPLITYRITIIEPLTQAKQIETIEYQSFTSHLLKRARFYTSFSIKNSPGYKKIEVQPEDKVFDFLTKQLLECQKLLIQLNALDNFFKVTPAQINRIKVRGIKIEITAIKNTLVKTNQRKADYNAIIEERNQLRKLGIQNV